MHGADFRGVGDSELDTARGRDQGQRGIGNGRWGTVVELDFLGFGKEIRGAVL